MSKSMYTSGFCSLVDVRMELSRRLTWSRFMHSIRVAETAVALACLHGVNPDRALVAGLLHDCARDMSNSELLEFARVEGLQVESSDHDSPVVLHGRVGAFIAERDFGVTDEQILRAIAVHPFGAARWSGVEQVLFVADYIEPGRSFVESRVARGIAYYSLEAAVSYKFLAVSRFLRGRGKILHPRFLEAFEVARREGKTRYVAHQSKKE